MLTNKENSQQPLSPSFKKKIRICSLNSNLRKALTESCINESTPDLFSPRSSSHVSNINIPPSKPPKPNHTPSEQFDKLLQITSRCVDYYNKFIEQKDMQVKTVKDAFTDIHHGLNSAFNGIINEVKAKHKELKQFLQGREKQLVEIKNQQERQLNESLVNVKSVHLQNLLNQYKPDGIINMTNSNNMQGEFARYANTLHKFYEAMQKVQNSHFKQMVDETINFINNIITEQIKIIVYEKIPNMSLNASFSFNDGLGFGNSNIHQINQVSQAKEDSIAIDSVEQSLNVGAKKAREVGEAWTQTLGNVNSFGTKEKGVIHKRQKQMETKINKYFGVFV